uniref:Uncharacterized protein n=1 Tax=Oryza nivara TaxID=4536 RepID=A0A0E0FK29_ORYNI
MTPFFFLEWREEAAERGSAPTAVAPSGEGEEGGWGREGRPQPPLPPICGRARGGRKGGSLGRGVGARRGEGRGSPDGEAPSPLRESSA